MASDKRRKSGLPAFFELRKLRFEDTPGDGAPTTPSADPSPPAKTGPTHEAAISGASSFSETSTLATTRGGVSLVEVIASDATVLRRGSADVSRLLPGSPDARDSVTESTSPSRTPAEKQQQDHPDVAQDASAPGGVPPGKCGSLRRVGTTKRTMSYRGKAPRLVKVRVVGKVDSKSYFSAERTMYQWMYIGTSMIGYGLSLYAYQAHIDAAVRDLGTKSATLLACLGMCVAYYAAAYFYRRREALKSMCNAAVFDDRFSPKAITLVIAAVFVVYTVLSWMNYEHFVVKLKHSSFGANTRQHNLYP